MKNFVIVLIVALLVALVLGGAWYFAEVYPWIRAIPGDVAERDAQWAEVEVLASLDDVAQGDPAHLIKAELAIERRLTELQELTARAANGPLPKLRSADLPEEGRVAMRELLEWHDSGGGLGMAACGDELEAVPLLTLGRLLLSTSRDARRPEVEATLRMAAALRASGDLAQVTVGFHMADDARRWVEEHGVRPTSVFAATRPRLDEIPVAMAREAVCVYREAERDLSGDKLLPWLLGLSPEDGGPWLGRQRVTLARERTAWQVFSLPRVTGARDAGGDLKALRNATRLPNRGDLPTSALVRVYATDPTAQIERWGQISRDYDSLLTKHRLQ